MSMILRSPSVALAWIAVVIAPSRMFVVDRLVPVPAHVQTASAQEQPKVVLSEAEAAALPDTAGRESVAGMCAPCHGVLTVTTQRHTAAGWASVVDDMFGKGATGTDEEAEAVVVYLARHFPAVNVNAADATELARVLKIAKVEAEAIVAYRQSNPPFKTSDDLKRVPGVDPKIVDQQRAAIAFSGK